MKLSAYHLTTLADVAIEAARTAGKHIAETRPLDIQHKSGSDSLATQVVTEVDQQSQDLILQILSPTFSEFDLALLTEESEDDGGRLKKDYFWCIDPIDGTLPFIEGVPGYAVSIALVSREGIPHTGVVFDPVENTLYHAVRNQGAFKNSKPWVFNSDSRDKPLSIFTDRSVAQQPYFAEVIAALKESGYPDLKIETDGGAVMNACRVLDNDPACYFKFPREGASGGCLWDYSATACIYGETAAIATDISGNPMDLNRSGSAYMNHRGILYATDPELARQIMRCFTDRP
jgi:3'(2'), 5'-bisphosphate nucleotidase/myo-inositol-1(or 4)-monophosphatase